jgi:phage protein U
MAVEGIYGAIAFGRARGRIMTFHEIERKYTGRFTSHMVHLRKPLLEWAGNDLVEINVKVNLNAAWCGDPNPLLAEWHFFHENAFAAPLIIGSKPMGPGLSLFVITEMQETHKHWLKRGRLIAVELSITFKEYIPFSEGLLSALGIPAFPGSNLIGAGSL